MEPASVEHADPKSLSVEALWKMPEVELLEVYYDARRRHVEKKFARDSQRARLEWLKAKAFVAGSGGVTDRKNAVDASEDLGRRGQELRDMSRDLDLLKIDGDLIAMIIRWRSGSAPTDAKVAEPPDREEEEEGA
ncbi:MAG: hypothetical protein ACHQAY_24030 [Hyphomicrobiales bacterium]